MSQFDTEIYKQMVGVPPRPEVKPTSDIQIPDVPSASPAPDGSESNGQTKREWPLPPHLTPEDDFMRDQAVAQAPVGIREPDTPVVILSPRQLEGLDAQAKSATSPMSDADRAFWDLKSGKTQADQVAQSTQSSASPDQRPRLRDALGTAREHGREMRGDTSVFARLIRAKDRAKQALSGVTDVLIRKGYSISNNITDVHDLYVGLRDDADVRKVVAEAAVKATQEVIDVPFALAGETLEKMLTVKIRIGDKEYVPIDEMIKTAEAVESSIINTKNSAVELARMTARGIKNRIQDTIDVARIARNLTLAKLVEDRKRDRETMQKRIESAENGVWLAQEILRKVERGIDRVRTKGDTPEHLQSVAMAKRQEAFGILGSLIARKDAIFGIRQMAETPKTQVIEPQVEAVQEPEGPITGSKDPRFRSLSNFEQQVIFDREEREAKKAPQSELPVNHPQHPTNTIL